MRFVTVRDLRGKPKRVWNELSKQGELVITSNGKPIAILTPTSEATLEESLASLRSARALRSLQEIQRQSIRAGTSQLSSRQIDAEIRATRRGRSA